MRLESSTAAELDAEEQGFLSAPQPKLHTDGAPEHNITRTIEYIKYQHEIMHTGRHIMYV